MKIAEERIKKTAEEKRKKEEKQKEKETMMKEEALKKQKLAELRLAEINAKRKLAEEAKNVKIVIYAHKLFYDKYIICICNFTKKNILT